MVDYKPEGYRTITPYLTINGVSEVIEFLKKAFDVKDVKACNTADDGTIMHAEVLIGDSWIMMGEAGGDHKAAPACLYMYVPNVDKVYATAIEAGGVSIMEPTDMFYGDRNAGVKDSAGNSWWIATHVEDVSPQEMEKRAKEHHKKPALAKK
jgi:PhnB protein